MTLHELPQTHALPLNELQAVSPRECEPAPQGVTPTCGTLNVSFEEARELLVPHPLRGRTRRETGEQPK